MITIENKCHYACKWSEVNILTAWRNEYQFFLTMHMLTHHFGVHPICLKGTHKATTSFQGSQDLHKYSGLSISQCSRLQRRHFSGIKKAREVECGSGIPGIGTVPGLAKIKVIGVGGGGGNAVNRMVESGLQVCVRATHPSRDHFIVRKKDWVSRKEPTQGVAK